jgi:hypothetical protein
MILLRSTQIVQCGSGSGDEWDIDTAAERAFRAAGSVADGSADRDAVNGQVRVAAGGQVKVSIPR